MRILAIDPGLRVSGYVLLAGARVELSGVLPNEEIVDTVIPSLLEPGTLLAIEEIMAQGQHVGLDVFRTVRWYGRFEERWLRLGGPPVRFVFRKDVKRHLIGTASGKDQQVRCALLDLWGGEEAALGPKGQKVKKGEAKIRGPLYGISSHAWSALAVAVTVRDAPAGSQEPPRPPSPSPRPATNEAPDAPIPGGAVLAPPDPLGTQFRAVGPRTEP